MQCKGQGYMMLKDTTCKIKRYQLKILNVKLKGTIYKYLLKLILPLQMSPCDIRDLSLAF